MASRKRRVIVNRRPVLRSMFLSGATGGEEAEALVPSAEHSTFEWDDYAITANGSAQAVPTIVIRDQYGNALSGVALTMTPRNVVASASNSSLDVSPAAIEDDGVEAATAQLTAVDTLGEPIPDVLAADAPIVSNETATITPGTQTGDAGTLSASVTSTDPATHTLSATVDGVAITDTASLLVGTGEGGGEAPGGDFFYEMTTVEATVRATQNGVIPLTGDAETSVQAVPAGQSGYGIRLRAGPGGSAEQRFTIGRNCAEFALQFNLYVPSNFVHNNDSPNNNKFFQLWRNPSNPNGYSDVSGGTARCGIEYTTNAGTTPNSLLRCMSSRWDYNSNDSSGLNMTGNFAAFIGGSGPIPIGDWCQVRIYVKPSTDRTTSDGVYALWVDGVLVAVKTDWKFNNYYDTPSGCYFGAFYLGGSNNAQFDEATDFFLHEVKIAETLPTGWDYTP